MIKGVIEKLTVKDVKTKNGIKPTWSINVDGQWYGGIWDKPSYSEGDYVEFDTTQRVYKGQTYYSVSGLVNVLNQQSSTNGSTGTAPAKKTTTKRYNCTCEQFPINPLDRQMSIIIQSSINRATEIALAKYNTSSATDQKKVTTEDLVKEVLALTDLIAAKASGQDLMEEILLEKKEKYEEYQKLLQGELDDDPSQPEQPE